MRPIVLDAGALIAVERRTKFGATLVNRIVMDRIPTFVPAGVVAQVWRGSPRQHDIATLLKSKALRVDPLDDLKARKIGVLLGKANAKDATDGHVAYLALILGNAVVFTSDRGDIQAIDSRIEVFDV